MLLVSRVDRTKSAGVSNAFCEQTDKSRWLPPILLVFQMSHGLTINRLQLNGQKQLAVRIKEKKIEPQNFSGYLNGKILSISRKIAKILTGSLKSTPLRTLVKLFGFSSSRLDAQNISIFLS